MTNLFGSLDIEIWDLFGIWCFEFDISAYPDARDGIFKKCLSIGHSTAEFYISGLAVGYNAKRQNTESLQK
jgi:hypothetical protein